MSIHITVFGVHLGMWWAWTAWSVQRFATDWMVQGSNPGRVEISAPIQTGLWGSFTLLYKVVSKIFETNAVKIVKLTIRLIGHRHPRSSSLPHVDTGPTVSSIFGTLPGRLFLSQCQALCDSACIFSMVPNRRPYSLNFIFGNRKNSQGTKSGE